MDIDHDRYLSIFTEIYEKTKESLRKYYWAHMHGEDGTDRVENEKYDIWSDFKHKMYITESAHIRKVKEYYSEKVDEIFPVRIVVNGTPCLVQKNRLDFDDIHTLAFGTRFAFVYKYENDNLSTPETATYRMPNELDRIDGVLSKMGLESVKTQNGMIFEIKAE